jgi:trimeric autotransporter adhesin
MKKLVLISGLLLVLGIGAYAQADPKRKGVSGAGSASSQVLIGQGTRIDGELQNKVDVKDARVGDQVVLKTTKAIKSGGETVVPKGSRLIGRITDVQQRTKANGGSRLGMVFDRIEGKGLSSPISASIVSITNAAASGRIADTAEADLSGSSATSANAGRSTGGSGGGLLGGVTNTVGGVLNTTTQTAGGVTNTAARAVDSTTGAVGRTINGIQISNSASGSAGAATTLSSRDRNIRLEKGVTIGLQVNSSVRAQ